MTEEKFYSSQWNNCASPSPHGWNNLEFHPSDRSSPQRSSHDPETWTHMVTGFLGEINPWPSCTKQLHCPACLHMNQSSGFWTAELSWIPTEPKALLCPYIFVPFTATSPSSQDLGHCWVPSFQMLSCHYTVLPVLCQSCCCTPFTPETKL
jgi:hypothetical protein